MFFLHCSCTSHVFSTQLILVTYCSTAPPSLWASQSPSRWAPCAACCASVGNPSPRASDSPRCGMGMPRPGMVRDCLGTAGCCWILLGYGERWSVAAEFLFLTLGNITWQNFTTLHWVLWAVVHAFSLLSHKKTCGLSWKLQDRRGCTPGDRLHQIAWLMMMNGWMINDQ